MKRSILTIGAFLLIGVAVAVAAGDLLPRSQYSASIGKSGQGWSNGVFYAIICETETGTNTLTTEAGLIDGSKVSGGLGAVTLPLSAITNAGNLAALNNIPKSLVTNLPSIVSSVDGVSNDGGDIDLIEGTGVTITPNDSNNQITFAVNSLTGICTRCTVATTPVSPTQATITVTCLNALGSGIGGERAVTFWFATATQQTTPSIDGIESWSYVAHGSVVGYWDLGYPDGLQTNYVYVATTHTDGTMDFLVTADAGVGTNYFSVLGPNGYFSRTKIEYITP